MPSCDDMKDQGGIWQTLVDTLFDVTCDDGEAEEGGDRNAEGRRQNPCVQLEDAECEESSDCDLQESICVWNEPEENRRNLYVTYEWHYLMEDGELTDEPWCYSDADDSSASTDESAAGTSDDESTEESTTDESA